jgi:hypothetical protein
LSEARSEAKDESMKLGQPVEMKDVLARNGLEELFNAGNS